MSNPYRNGLDFLVPLLNPTSDRVLLRAILQTDGSDLAIEGADVRRAICHFVVRCGPDVKDIQEGQHVIHISAAGDSLDGDPNSTSRFCLVREEDIVAYWQPSDLGQLPGA